jgi:hypothetical protein
VRGHSGASEPQRVYERKQLSQKRNSWLVDGTGSLSNGEWARSRIRTAVRPRLWV